MRGLVLLRVLDDAVERVAFDVELRVWVLAKKPRQHGNVVRSDVPLVWPWVDGNPVRTSVEAEPRAVQDAWNPNATRVA